MTQAISGQGGSLKIRRIAHLYYFSIGTEVVLLDSNAVEHLGFESAIPEDMPHYEVVDADGWRYGIEAYSKDLAVSQWAERYCRSVDEAKSVRLDDPELQAWQEKLNRTDFLVEHPPGRIDAPKPKISNDKQEN